MTSEEVRELYWRGGAEANESTDIVFLSTKVGDLIHHKYIGFVLMIRSEERRVGKECRL